jgi:uncharacterized protein
LFLTGYSPGATIYPGRDRISLVLESPLMAIVLARIVQAVLGKYALPLEGVHGVAHWARVLENGRRLASETGASIEVVELFAVLHDSRRLNEDTDPEHGPRAAAFARRIRGRLFDLPEADFQLLHRACAGHTHERTHPDITIRTCWDADRLDLGRVGMTPDPRYLCTEAARKPETIRWADRRGTLGFIPDLVEFEWGVELGQGLSN